MLFAVLLSVFHEDDLEGFLAEALGMELRASSVLSMLSAVEHPFPQDKSNTHCPPVSVLVRVQ